MSGYYKGYKISTTDLGILKKVILYKDCVEEVIGEEIDCSGNCKRCLLDVANDTDKERFLKELVQELEQKEDPTSIDAQVEKLREEYNIGRIKIRLDQGGCWWVYIDWNFKGEVAYPKSAQGANTDLEKAFESARKDIGKSKGEGMITNKCRECDRDLPDTITVCKYCLEIKTGVSIPYDGREDEADHKLRSIKDEEGENNNG